MDGMHVSVFYSTQTLSQKKTEEIQLFF